MATLALVNDTLSGRPIGLRLMCLYEQKDIAKSIPGGRWDPKRTEWRFPLNELTVTEARKAFPALGLTNQCENWFIRVINRRYQLELMRNQADTEIPWVNAHRLRPYQRVDISYILEVGRLLVAGDMGIGKTVEALVASEIRGHQRVLIICNDIAKLAWASEIEKWLGTDDYVVVDGVPKKRIAQFAQEKRFTIMNHDLLLFHPELENQTYDLIIVDEAHKYKNRKAKRTEVLSRLTRKCGDLYLLTGTPIKSKSYDIWSPLHMIDPHRFSSFWGFVARHHETEETSFGTVISKRVKDTKWLNYELQPYMVRRMKTDPEVREYMPDKTYKFMRVKMSAEQKRLYKDMAKEMEASHGGVTVSAPNALSKITRLRQISSAPGLIFGSPLASPKVDAAIDIIQDLECKVVVFSMFRESLVMMAAKLKELDIPYLAITGKVKSELRPAIQQQFWDSDTHNVMLATIDTCGESISFACAPVCIFLDRHWNPGDNSQVEDRLCRSGQLSNCVTVVIMQLKDSVDVWMDAIENDKQGLIDSVVNRGHEMVKILKG